MIRTIRVHDESMELVPSAIQADPGLNLFAADSMTLVVGPNGAGKTRLLVAIAEAVVDGDVLAVDSSESLSDVEVIYLTLSNFGKPPFSRVRKRIHVLQRGRATEKLAGDERTLSLLRSLGRRPTHVLRLNSTVNDILKLVMREVTMAGAEKGQVSFELSRLLMHLEDLERLRQREERSNPEISSRWFDSDLYKKTKGARHSMERVLVDELCRGMHHIGLGNISFGVFMRALSSVVRAERSSDAIKYLLSAMGVVAYNEISPNHPEPHLQIVLRTEAEKLQWISNIVGDENLAKNEYSVHERDVASLTDPALSSVAGVEVKGASSGMAALVSQFGMIKSKVDGIHAKKGRGKNLLLLIDEGDVFLHLAWQQKYVNLLDKFAKDLKASFNCVQIILTTHSPVLMSDFPRDCVHKLRQGKAGGSSAAAPLSFGAQLADVVNVTGDAGTMGEFSRKHIKRWSERLDKGDSVSQYHLDLIDDPVIKRMLERKRTRVRTP